MATPTWTARDPLTPTACLERGRYLYGEYVCIGLSFVAKSLLAWQTLAGSPAG